MNNPQKPAPQENISGSAVANSYQAPATQQKTAANLQNAKPATQTYGNGPGYTKTNGQYAYDARYGTYNPNTDYTAKLQQAQKGGNNKAAAYYEAMANQKVQSLFPNNPKYHTQDNYGSYLNQLSDSYINYLSGKSNDAYTVDANTAAMLGTYDKSYQYSDAIKQADKEGNYTKAAILEYLMNQKIKNEGLPYIQQDNYSSYLNGVTQSDVNMAKYGVDVSPTGRYYKVNPDGHSPKGLVAGDYVVTGGGTYMITGVDADGNYTGAIKVDGTTNTSNYKGTYSTPSSVLEQQGLDTTAGRATDMSQFQLNAPNLPAAGLSTAAAPTVGLSTPNAPGVSLNTPNAPTVSLSTPNVQSPELSAPNVPNPELSAPNVPGVSLDTPNASAFQVNPASVGNIDVTSTATVPGLRDVFMPNQITEADLQDLLQQQFNASQQRALNQIDYATQTGTQELQRAYDDSLPNYSAQRGQVDLDADKGAKNAALYAEQRGDRGGIGAAQYSAMQIARANQLNQINTAQNKAASDTARAIADLRAKGEFEKADKLLELSQNYLSQLMQNKQWLANYNLNLAQFDQSLRNDETNYLNMVAELTGKFNGQNTMGANQANANMAIQLAPYTGTIFGQQTLQSQQQNIDNAMNMANMYGVDQNGNTTLAGREFVNNAQNQYANMYGVDQYGNRTLAGREYLDNARNQIANMYGVDQYGNQTLAGREYLDNARNNIANMYGVDQNGNMTLAGREFVNNAQNQLTNMFGVDQYGNQTLSAQQYLNDAQNQRASLYGVDQYGNRTLSAQQYLNDAQNQLANMFGVDQYGNQTLSGQQYISDLQNQRANMYGVDQYGNTTLSGRQFTEDLLQNYRNNFGVDPLTGQKTSSEAQRITDNYYKNLDAFGYDRNTGQQTLQYQQMQIDNANAERDYALNLAQSFAQWGILPSTQQLNQAGVTDTAMQAQIRYYAQMMAAQNLVNGGAEAMMLYPNGYPTGTASSVTTGGGVGTSTGSGGSGGSGGSKKSGGNPTPAPSPAPAAKPKQNVKIDAVTSAQPASKTQSVVKQVNALLRNT